jgi:hypothetical protein
MKIKKMDNLYDWLFHYNIYTKKWEAFKRDEVAAFGSGKAKLITSSNINTLIEIVKKTNGDTEKLRLNG